MAIGLSPPPRTALKIMASRSVGCHQKPIPALIAHIFSGQVVQSEEASELQANQLRVKTKVVSPVPLSTQSTGRPQE